MGLSLECRVSGTIIQYTLIHTRRDNVIITHLSFVERAMRRDAHSYRVTRHLSSCSHVIVSMITLIRMGHSRFYRDNEERRRRGGRSKGRRLFSLSLLPFFYFFFFFFYSLSFATFALSLSRRFLVPVHSE